MRNRQGQIGGLKGWSSLGPRNRRQHLGWGLQRVWLCSDWLVVRQQSSGPGILCSAWSYHPPPGWGPQFCRRTQRYCCAYFLSRNQDPASRLYHHLIAPSRILYPLPFLISNCLNLLFGTQGRSRRLNETYNLQTRSGQHRTDWYSRAPWSSAQF